MDLLARIKSNMRGIDFDYEVELVPDNKYGNKDVFSEEWDGMIGEVVRRVRIFFLKLWMIVFHTCFGDCPFTHQCILDFQKLSPQQ